MHPHTMKLFRIANTHTHTPTYSHRKHTHTHNAVRVHYISSSQVQDNCLAHLHATTSLFITKIAPSLLTSFCHPKLQHPFKPISLQFLCWLSFYLYVSSYIFLVTKFPMVPSKDTFCQRTEKKIR